MFDSFNMRAEAVSAVVQRFQTKDEALDFILALFQDEGVKDEPGSYAVWADCPAFANLDKSAMAAKVPGLKFEVTKDLAKDARVGVTQAEWGLANTGSLAQDSTAVEQRLASSLPFTHVALLDSGKILPDLPSLFPKLSPASSDYIALITGPSRTADIERVLTIGVHGPERLFIVCVDGLESSEAPMKEAANG